MALIADTADFFAGLFTLDFKKMGNALGFGYASGNGSKYQTLQDSYAAKSWGSSASDLSKAYEEAVAATTRRPSVSPRTNSAGGIWAATPPARTTGRAAGRG